MIEHKQIPLSKRGYIYFIEHTRVKVENGTLVYLKSENGIYKSYNIPYINTSLLMLGEGTSITRDAVAMLSDSGALLMFVGGGGTPLHSSSDLSFTTISPESEYRPTQYMQKWIYLFMDEDKRLLAAKQLMQYRIENIQTFYDKTQEIQEMGITSINIKHLIEKFKENIVASTSTQELLLSEARFVKDLYAFFSKTIRLKEFIREQGKDSNANNMDIINGFLDYGNYLCYGLGSVVLNGLGISYSLPLLHGKTRRGALVFDVADMVKDAICLPLAFYCGINGNSDREFREKLIWNINSHKILDKLFEQVKNIATMDDVHA